VQKGPTLAFPNGAIFSSTSFQSLMAFSYLHFSLISPALIGTPLLIFDSPPYRSAMRHPPPNTRLSTTISPDNRLTSYRIAGDEAPAEDSETTYIPRPAGHMS
jgi:hypothetical protein